MKPDNFKKYLSSISSSSLSVINTSIPKSKYIPIDLSESNETLNNVDVSSSSKLEVFVNNHIRKHDALVAYGGYLELRNIYKRSNHFKSQGKKERNIHLGIDLWCNAETPVHTPLDGVVHSFKNNTNYGDYGPTIILKHKVEDVEFYSLYGHLSLDSIINLQVGKFFNKGNIIGTLGDASVNGDYPPHLHFQIIKDLQKNQGDYPGVSDNSKLQFFENNCPDPNLLLKLDLK